MKGLLLFQKTQFSLSWICAKGCYHQRREPSTKVTTDFAILLCTQIFTFPESILYSNYNI